MYIRKRYIDCTMFSIKRYILLCATGLTLAIAPVSAYADSGTMTYSSSFDFKFGSLGTGDGQFDELRAVFVDESGNIYTSERSTGNGRIQRFTPNGAFSARTTNNSLSGFQLRIDESGNLVVADDITNEVRAFNTSGLSEITNAVFPISTSGSFSIGLAQDPDTNNYYVSDLTDDVIRVFDESGSLINSFGSTGSGNGQLEQPSRIDIFDDKIYISDAGNDRVAVFDLDGNFIQNFGSLGTGDNQFDALTEVNVDEFGNIYVMDRLNHSVKIYDSDFNFLHKFGSDGSADGQFLTAVSVFADSTGRIIVGDNQRDDVQVFNFTSTETFSGSPTGGGDESATTAEAHLELYGSGGSYTFNNDFLDYDSVEIFNPGGEWVLGGTSTFDDTVDITGGMAVVNGELIATGDFALDNAATLGGSGSVESLGGDVIFEGTVSPGNSIGTLTVVSASAEFDSGSVLEIEATPSAADSLNVIGDLSINSGDVNVTASGTQYAVNTDYVIISATSSVSGTFDSVIDNLAFLDSSLVYTSDTVTLNLSRNDATFDDFADADQQGEAQALSTLLGGSGGDITTVSNFVNNLRPSEVRQFIAENSADQVSGLQTVVSNIDTRAQDLVSARLSAVRMGRNSNTSSGANLPLMLSDASDNTATQPFQSDNQMQFGLNTEDQGQGSYYVPGSERLWGMLIGSLGGVDGSASTSGY